MASTPHDSRPVYEVKPEDDPGMGGVAGGLPIEPPLGFGVPERRDRGWRDPGKPEVVWHPFRRLWSWVRWLAGRA